MKFLKTGQLPSFFRLFSQHAVSVHFLRALSASTNFCFRLFPSCPHRKPRGYYPKDLVSSMVMHSLSHTKNINLLSWCWRRYIEGTSIFRHCSQILYENFPHQLTMRKEIYLLFYLFSLLHLRVNGRFPRSHSFFFWLIICFFGLFEFLRPENTKRWCRPQIIMEISLKRWRSENLFYAGVLEALIECSRKIKKIDVLLIRQKAEEKIRC